MGADGHLESDASLVVLALLGVKHGQIVVRLREFRKILGQFLKNGDGFGAAVKLGQHHPFQKANLSVSWLGGQNAVGAFECLGELSLFDKGLEILDGIRPNGAADQACEEQGGDQGSF
jgi:hypothetical protein